MSLKSHSYRAGPLPFCPRGCPVEILVPNGSSSVWPPPSVLPVPGRHLGNPGGAVWAAPATPHLSETSVMLQVFLVQKSRVLVWPPWPPRWTAL